MSDYFSYQTDQPEPSIEDSELYKLICACSKSSIRDAWRLAGNMQPEDIKMRSTKDRSTYLHLVVNIAPEVHKKYGEITMLIPLIYRLALQGIRVNAQNEHGNTCLHLACIKPHAHVLYPHLIRIGCDPCMKNKKECRVIHTYRNHQCALVKGQLTAKSGLWNAVEKEDKDMVQKLLKSWCRVRVKKNKYLKDVADETANIYIIKMLDQYEIPNEVACTAFSCDVPKLKELLARGGVDLNMRDEACDVPKPLVVAIEELGEIGRSTVKVLKSHGATDGSDFPSEVEAYHSSFEESPFHQLIERGSDASILEALDLITDKKVDVNLISYREETSGWNYMHYMIDRYTKIKADNEERSRLIVRGMYRLALAGIDVNARDTKGDTPLVKASATGDQNLITHLLRLGGDASITDKEGRTVSVYVYEDKGKMVFDKKYRIADLPGLWVAIDSNDVDKAKRWCKSWARVNTCRGDRRMIDVARALKRKEIVRVLEQHEHINEFVIATFASDIRAMTNTIALGSGGKKTNSIDEFFHVGYTWDRHAEFICRPIIISALDLCTPEVVDFLLKFGANLSKEHEENPPCGPIAFWAFHDHVSNENALVVAKHADIELRDELGCTMLHRAIRKNRREQKVEIVLELLDRGVDLAARDYEGSTARDYIAIYDVADAYLLRQTMDDFVLNLVNDEQTIQLENLLVSGYDHVMDITGLRRNRVVSARDIAVLKEYKDIVEMFEDWEEYQSNIELLHKSAKEGDLKTISKISSEKRYAYGLDKAGRTLLHQAVLYQQPDIVEFLCEQYPNLINSRDSLKRIPLHLCVCLKERQLIWPTLQDAGADPNLVDVNAMSVYDYVRELETPTAPKDKPRGRRWRNYKPENVIVTERNQEYGSKAARYELTLQLKKVLKESGSLKDIQALTKKIKADLSMDSLDCELLRVCVENQRASVAQHLIEACHARVNPQVRNDEGHTVSLLEFAESRNCDELVTYIREHWKPEVEQNGVEQNGDVTTQVQIEQTQS